MVQWLTPSGEGIFEEGIEPDQVVALPTGGTMLFPDDLGAMDRRDFRTSDDAQLRRAVRLLTDDPDGTPRPPSPPSTDPPAASAGPSDAPPSALLGVDGRDEEDPGA